MKLITIVLALFLLSINVVSASESSKKYFKNTDLKLTNQNIDSQELRAVKTKLQSLVAKTKKRKGGGGKTNSVDIIGTYSLTDDSDPSTLYLDIVSAEIKDGDGAVEVVLTNSDGNVLEHTVGIVVKNKLIFNRVFLNGGQLYAFNLNPKQNYSGPGITIYEILGVNCFDDSGDGVVEVDEYYSCQYTEPILGSADTALRRLN